MSWRFWSFARNERVGILLSPDHKGRCARFLTPEEAKAEAQLQRRAA